MSDRERHPGLFQTAEGGWMTHEDFLKFVAGAFTAKGRHNRTSMAWLKRQSVTSPIESLSPKDASRLCATAQRIILARKGREKHTLPRLEETAPPSPGELSEEPD